MSDEDQAEGMTHGGVSTGWSSESVDVLRLSSPQIRITIWRALNTIVLSAFGVAKAVTVAKGNPAVNTLDMFLGLVWTLV